MERLGLNLQSVVSKNMRSVQYKRPLASVFDKLYVEMNQASRGDLSNMGRDELYLLSMSLPMHWLDQKCRLEGQEFATDASEEGGGACGSTGLTKWGQSRIHTLGHCDLGLEGAAADPILVVECFAGIGGLKQALDLLGVVPMGNIAIDNSADCGKVLRQQCRHVLLYNSIEDISMSTVKEWRLKFPRVKKVILGGGWPCINHSQLNPRRQGADAASSRLLDKMLELKDGLKACSSSLGMADWEVIEFFENVVMDGGDYKVQSKKIGHGGLFCEAAQLGHCRRPRIYWIKGVSFIRGKDGQLVAAEKMRNQEYHLPAAHFKTEKPPLRWFLDENAQKLTQDQEQFCTFTRPKLRSSPPEQPAGYDQCTAKALARWRGDGFRVQPYQYMDNNLVTDDHGPRRLKPAEQLRMMGFVSSHLELKSKLSADAKGQLIGNSFSVITVARLLVGLVLSEEDCVNEDLTLRLWMIWKQKEDKFRNESKPWKSRFGSAAVDIMGGGSLRSVVSPSASLPLQQALDPEKRLTDEELLVYLLTRNATHKGADIRMDFGLPYSVGEQARHSIDPASWTWKVLMSYAWKKPGQHINVLETVAVLDLLRKLARTPKYHQSRLVILVDNQVALSVLAKGRTSARALQSPLRRVAAVLLATGQLVCYGWVRSSWNPADAPSRWGQRKVKKKTKHAT